MVFIAAWCCVASEDLSSEPVFDDHEKEEDEDEMVFVSAWCCAASVNLPSETTVTHLDEDDSVGSMSILKGREDYDSSDDEEDDFVSSKSPRITKDTGNYLLALLQYLAL
jgi:hypothetical protein